MTTKLLLLGLTLCAALCTAGEPVSKAFIDGTGPGWIPLGQADFTNVNCYSNSWSFENETIRCTGQPVGVIRTTRTFTNFEAVVFWRHMKPAGNSGMFVWVRPSALENLQPGQLPSLGIEVQMLDHAYRDQYEKGGRKGTWFTTHGDIFAVGKSKLKPFAPLSPDGSRSFPRKELSKGAGEWNHYYVRCINGEVRLWVNGEEVSGGTGAQPASGYLCLESEGSPIVFRGLRIRELP